MFNNARIKELEDQIIEIRRNEARTNSDYVRRLDHKDEDCQREITSLTADFESKERIWKQELQTKIEAQTADLKADLSTAKSNASKWEAEVEMYKTAFKNLGFDVKDMKEILNKLVDGLVSKNQIQLINTSSNK